MAVLKIEPTVVNYIAGMLTDDPELFVGDPGVTESGVPVPRVGEKTQKKRSQPKLQSPPPEVPEKPMMSGVSRDFDKLLSESNIR